MTRVLIVKLSSIGDIFHVLPTVHEIKQQLGAEIDWVTQSPYVSLVSCFDDVERVYEFDRRRFVRSLWALRRELRTTRYDWVVDLQGLLKSSVVAFQADAEKRIGPSYRREGAGLFYHDAAPRRQERGHAVEEAMDILQTLGLRRPERPFWPVSFPPCQLTVPTPRVGIIPVSRWQSKNWPVGHYTSFAQQLREQIPSVNFVLMGAPEDREACLAIESALPFAVQNLCGTCSLPETGGAIEQLDLLVAGDSGPTHMAVALGTPALVLYGPTAPGRTGPYGEIHTTLEHDVECRPCRHRVCPIDHRCLTRLTPEHVASSAGRMLGA